MSSILLLGSKMQIKPANEPTDILHFSDWSSNPGVGVWETRRSTSRSLHHKHQSEEHLSFNKRVQNGGGSWDQHAAESRHGEARLCCLDPKVMNFMCDATNISNNNMNKTLL